MCFDQLYRKLLSLFRKSSIPEPPQEPRRLITIPLPESINLKPGMALKTYHQSYVHLLQQHWQAGSLQHIPPYYQPSQPLPKIVLPPRQCQAFRPIRLQPFQTTAHLFTLEATRSKLFEEVETSDKPIDENDPTEKRAVVRTNRIGTLEALTFCENWQDLGAPETEEINTRNWLL